MIRTNVIQNHSNHVIRFDFKDHKPDLKNLDPKTNAASLYNYTFIMYHLFLEVGCSYIVQVKLFQSGRVTRQVKRKLNNRNII